MVRVRFFGPIADAMGTRGLELDCSNVEAVLAACADRLEPGVAAHLDKCVLWVNGRPADEAAPLAPGDEVALLSPVSGG